MKNSIRNGAGSDIRRNSNRKTMPIHRRTDGRYQRYLRHARQLQEFILITHMHEASYPITRAHKLKRIEEEFLRRLSKVDKPAYEVTAQQFFTYIAEEQQAEEDRLLLARPKKRNYYRTRITYETEKIMVQEAMNKPW